MPTVNIGCVAAVATFAELFTWGERASALRPFEHQAEGEPPELLEELSADYAARCQAAIKRALGPRWPQSTTLQAHGAYGYAEHDEDCFRLGCHVATEETEAEQMHLLLGSPELARRLNVELARATRGFLNHTLPRPLFDQLTCTFEPLARPLRD